MVREKKGWWALILGHYGDVPPGPLSDGERGMSVSIEFGGVSTCALGCPLNQANMKNLKINE